MVTNINNLHPYAEEQAAALRLQAMQRGRAARAEVAKLKAQGASREEVVLVEREAEDAAAFEGTEEEQAAAVKLQAMQRGRMARTQVSKLRDEGASDTNIAAKEAEAAMFEGTPEEQAAALRLQAMQRGRIARAEMEVLRASRASKKELARAERYDSATGPLIGRHCYLNVYNALVQHNGVVNML